MQLHNLSQLIDRLENVAEGSSELDRAIRDCLSLPAMLVPPDGGDEAYPYTTSLDCAITLVPEGWFYSASSGYGHANVHRRRGGTGGAWTHNAPTVPLAICIAALKARLAQGIVPREGGDAESGSGERSELEPGRPEGDAP